MKKIAYIGKQQVQELPETFWQRHNVLDQGPVAWGPKNNWEVPAGTLSDDAVRVLEARPHEYQMRE